MPGGPTRRTPEGALAPSFVNLSGDLSSSCKDIHSRISSNAIAAAAGMVSCARQVSGVSKGRVKGYTHRLTS